MRWDLVDRFEVLQKGKLARARKSYTGREDFFAEHEPGHPRVPEPLFIEMIAQAGGVLFGLGLDFKKEVILAKIEDASFMRQVAPPCLLAIEARVEDEREEGAWISGDVKLGEDVVATAKIMLVTMDSLTDDPRRMAVFNEEFISHYDIWNVVKSSQKVNG